MPGTQDAQSAPPSAVVRRTIFEFDFLSRIIASMQSMNFSRRGGDSNGGDLRDANPMRALYLDDTAAEAAVGAISCRRTLNRRRKIGAPK